MCTDPTNISAKRYATCVVADGIDAASSLAASLDLPAFGDIVPFGEPQAALQWCVSQCPRLVLVDQAMRTIDALAFVRQLRTSAGATQPMIALLASRADASLTQLAIAHGAVAVIPKPDDGGVWGPDLGVLLGSMARAGSPPPGATSEPAARSGPASPATASDIDQLAAAREAAGLLRRQLCADAALMRETLAKCATAWGMGPAPRDRLLAAWQLYAALPIVAPRAPSPAEGSQRLDDEQRLRSLAARALERARQNAGTREETPARWALQMALHGAENWDGSGRPLGLQGRDIPLPARLMHLVNSYGILRASSALGGAQLSAGAALARMEASCHHEFDPQLFAALKAVTQQEAAAAAVCA